MKRLGIIFLMLLNVFVGFGIIIPVLPELVSPYHLSLMLSGYSLISFIMSPMWGAWSDKIGRRPIILIGIAGYAISFFLFGIAEELWLMYVSRLLGGLFSGAVISCSVAYVADVTDEDNRTKGMGLVGMAIGLGFVIGPGVGAGLSLLGYSIPFFASSALALITLFLAALYLQDSLSAEERLARQKKREAAGRQSRWAAFRGAMIYLYVLSFIVSFTMSGLEFALYYYQAERIGITPFEMGMMFMTSGVVGALVQGGVVRRYIKKGDEPRFITIGLLLSATGFFLLIFSSSLLTATLFLTVFSAGNALVRPCVTSLITQKTPVGQGVASGLSSSMDSLGRITGPLVAMGAFYMLIQLPFVLGGAICLIGLLLLGKFLSIDRRQASTTAS
jgi:multidrug resistance protein